MFGILKRFLFGAPKPIDENQLAVEVTRLEAGVQQVNIAQTKEVMRCLFKLLANEYDPRAVRRLLKKHRKAT
jgi:transposase